MKIKIRKVIDFMHKIDVIKNIYAKAILSKHFN